MGKIIVNTKQIAEAFGVAEKYISELHRVNGMPKHGYDEWDLIECFQWRLNDVKRAGDEKINSIKSERSQDLLARRSAELKEITILEKQRQLVNRSDVQSAWLSELSIIINNFKGFGIKIEPIIAGVEDRKKIINLIDIEIDKILESISTYKLEVADESE